MNIEQLRESGKIIFECISGSRLYGTDRPESDIDIRGIFGVTVDDAVTLIETPKQISDPTNDVTFYSLDKFMTLASACNPNIIELLWVPESKTILKNSKFEKLLANRELFVSKKAYYTFAGYSFAQIKKATGQNKMINNPERKERPRREEFTSYMENGSSKTIGYGDVGFPNLDEYSVTKAYGKEAYRLYKIPKPTGVFDSEGNIRFTSLTVDEEACYFSGVLIYSKDAYEQKVKAWEKYWTWVNERNENRWVGLNNENFEYDMKNMAHCVRLALSCRNILTNGEPLVELTGENLKFIRSIRDGEFKYDYLMDWVKNSEAENAELFNKCTLPHHVDMHKINDVYRSIVFSK